MLAILVAPAVVVVVRLVLAARADRADDRVAAAEPELLDDLLGDGGVVGAGEVSAGAQERVVPFEVQDAGHRQQLFVVANPRGEPAFAIPAAVFVAFAASAAAFAALVAAAGAALGRLPDGVEGRALVGGGHLRAVVAVPVEALVALPALAAREDLALGLRIGKIEVQRGGVGLPVGLLPRPAAFARRGGAVERLSLPLPGAALFVLAARVRGSSARLSARRGLGVRRGRILSRFGVLRSGVAIRFDVRRA